MIEPSDSLFTVLLHRRPGCTYVVASGELDLVSAGMIEREIRLLLSAGVRRRRARSTSASSAASTPRASTSCCAARDAALASGARLHLLVGPRPREPGARRLPCPLAVRRGAAAGGGLGAAYPGSSLTYSYIGI